MLRDNSSLKDHSLFVMVFCVVKVIVEAITKACEKFLMKSGARITLVGFKTCSTYLYLTGYTIAILGKRNDIKIECHYTWFKDCVVP